MSQAHWTPADHALQQTLEMDVPFVPGATPVAAPTVGANDAPKAHTRWGWLSLAMWLTGVAVISIPAWADAWPLPELLSSALIDSAGPAALACFCAGAVSGLIALARRAYHGELLAWQSLGLNAAFALMALMLWQGV